MTLTWEITSCKWPLWLQLNDFFTLFKMSYFCSGQWKRFLTIKITQLNNATRYRGITNFPMLLIMTSIISIAPWFYRYGLINYASWIWCVKADFFIQDKHRRWSHTVPWDNTTQITTKVFSFLWGCILSLNIKCYLSDSFVTTSDQNHS